MTLPRLLPSTRRLEAHPGGPFLPSAATRILLPAGASDADRRAAETLRDGVREAITLDLQIAVADKPPNGADANAIAFDLAADADADLAALGPQGFRLVIDAGGARIASTGEPGRFYGAIALAQVAAEAGRAWPAVTIDERPALPTRGFMLDVSRGRVPTLDSLLALADTLARLRYNHLQLYTEHAFAFPGHEEIGAGADPLTPDDIRVLDRACRERHIELVPNLQALGHQPRLFALPRYAHLAETSWPWSFAVVNDGSATLLGALFAGMLPAFSSNLVNVNADEPWDIGRGQSAALAAAEGYGGVYERHLLRLHALLAARGKRMAMWADMFWHYPDVAARLPVDVLFLDWWYEARDDYPSVRVLAAAGREFWVCPGTSSWSAIFPRLENAVANIEGFVRAGVAAGATGMLLTEWGDGGHFQPPTHAAYAIAWAAECGWTGAADRADARAAFDAAFSRHVLRDGSGRQVAALRRLGAAMQTDANWAATWHSGMALFEDPLSGRQWSVADPAVIAEARSAALALSPMLAGFRDPAVRRDLSLAVAQALFATAKVETTRAIRALLSRLEGNHGVEAPAAAAHCGAAPLRQPAAADGADAALAGSPAAVEGPRPPAERSDEAGPQPVRDDGEPSARTAPATPIVPDAPGGGTVPPTDEESSARSTAAPPSIAAFSTTDRRDWAAPAPAADGSRTDASSATAAEADRLDPADLAAFDGLLADLRAARDRLPALAAEFEAGWLACSRRSGIAQTLDRYAALERRYDAALGWLDGQRAGWLAGQPVDAGLASYDRGGYAVFQEEARQMVLDLAAVVGRDRLPDDLQAFLAQTAALAEDRA